MSSAVIPSASLPLLPILGEQSSIQGGGMPQVAVGEGLQGLSQREQWLADLATLDRIEFQNACFFDAMGEIIRANGVPPL